MYNVEMAKTMHITQEGPANALALNKENTQVVIAGRNVFKIFTLDENEFVENYNLRVGKNLNLNFSCNHVAWNTIEDNILATAATNGAVVLWNLNKSSRSKQEHVFNDHKRTVNKVCFHVTDPSLLLSGSQDGTLKCFDIHNKEVIRTFYSNTESVRDVQFSPHDHHMFTAVSENGNVQLWDLRKHDKYYLQFTAHSGPIFACDWHPEQLWLATASRDKTIKIWDFSVKPVLKHTIHTIASIGQIKWRPQKQYHIASCALVVDCSINIWDIRRPYIPFASFDQHKDVASGIAWRGHPDVFLSTSRDCTVYQHVFRDAVRPVNSCNPQGVSLNAQCDVMYACQQSLDTSLSSKLSSVLRKVTSYNELFKQASSVVHQFTSKNQREASKFKHCALKYILVGKSLSELCDHNAEVARQVGKQQVSLVWLIIKALYGCQNINKTDYNFTLLRDDDGKNVNGSKLGISTRSGLDSDDKSIKGMDTSGVGLDDETETDDTLEFQYGYSNNIGFKSVNDFSNEFQMQGDFFFGDGECDPLSMDQLISNLPQEQDWTIQSEAFPLRHEIQEGSPQPDSYNNHKTFENEMESSTMAIEMSNIPKVTVNFHPVLPQIEPTELVVDALKYHANMGDIQTAVSVLCVLGDRRRELTSLSTSTQEHWLLSYLDTLARFQLWNISAEIIQSCWLPCVNQLSQQSTTIHSCCGECSKQLQRTGWLCDKCHTSDCAVCSICHQTVRGLCVWCQGCSHGGHLQHMTKWFKTNKYCPTGCGHACEY